LARREKLFAEESELFTFTVFLQHIIVRKTTPSKCILQGTKRRDDGEC
jgi:hypothetical protein